MSRAQALLRRWLDVPSRAELMPKLREVRVVVTALASERAAAVDPETDFAGAVEAARHADDVCRRYMACAPLEEEPQRPLVPMEPAPRATPAPRWLRLVWAAALLALGAAAGALHGCTIRGGESCSDVGCTDLRRPADAAVPAPGGPL